MNSKSVHREVKFKDNQRYLRVLKRGDMSILAEYSGYHPGSVANMLYGFRAMSDRLKKAIIRLLDERKELENQIEERLKELQPNQ